MNRVSKDTLQLAYWQKEAHIPFVGRMTKISFSATVLEFSKARDASATNNIQASTVNDAQTATLLILSALVMT